MKKLLALTLSLLLVFTVVPMVMVSAENYSAVLFTMDEGSRPSNVGITLRADYASYVDSGEEAYGNVLKVLRKGSRGDTQDQALGIKLPANIWTDYGTPVSITFEARTDSGYINFGPNDTSEYIYLNSSTASLNVSGFTAPIGDFSPTWKTYTFDLTSAKSREAIASGYLYLCFRNTWGNNTCEYYYMDNITFNYAPYVATFSGGVEGDQVVYANANGEITTPSATLTEGEFAGWTTEEDPETIIPADEKIVLKKDSTFYATATVRGEQNAPAAPTVAGKTGTTITLVANSAYQYSIDGVNWQSSNVFEDLEPGTVYTLYQRLKATPTAYASPASPAVTVETAVIHYWKFFNTSSEIQSDFTSVITPASGAGSLSVGTHSDNGKPTAMYTTRSLVTGDKLTFTSKTNLIPGIYKVTFQVRTYSGRAKTNISVNGTTYGEFNAGQNSNGAGQKFVLFEDLVVNEAGPAVVEFTATSSGSCYIEGMHFEKVGDVELPEVDGETSTAVATEDKASIRLDTDVQGIRFYSTINIEGFDVVEAGTLIGPTDLVGNYLTFDDVTVENAVVVPYDLSKGLYDDKYVVGSIVGIKAKNYARDFSARAYVVLADGTVMYSETTSTRNMADIADAYINDENSNFESLDADLKAQVELWAKAND